MGQRLDLFFDLDHTLWDFVSNSREALTELFVEFKLNDFGIPDVAQFLMHYEEENERCWMRYRNGEMKREVLRVARFHNTLCAFGLDHMELAAALAEAYVMISPSKTRLMPGSKEILEVMGERGHRMHILTNGFREVQHRKLKGSGLHDFFSGVYTSEELGFSKPHPKAFERALLLAKAHASNAWMIGDNLEADIQGAAAMGLTTVFYHPSQTPPEAPHHTIRHFDELKLLIDV